MYNYIILAIIIVFVYYYFFSHRESFTNDQTTLANQLITYFNSGQTNFAGYSAILKLNKNTSLNLGKLDTYKALSALGNTITVNNILNQL